MVCYQRISIATDIFGILSAQEYSIAASMTRGEGGGEGTKKV